MIDGLVKEKWYQVSRVDSGIIIDDAVPCRNIQIFYRGESKKVGCNKLFMIDFAVIGSIAICYPERLSAVDHHGIEPAVEIIKIKPFNRIKM